MAISNKLRVFLIRHAESTNNAIEKTKNRAYYETLRQADPELTEKGHTQAQHLAEYLSQHQLGLKISSSNSYTSLLQSYDSLPTHHLLCF